MERWLGPLMIRGYPLENTPLLEKKTLHSGQLGRSQWEALKELRASGENPPFNLRVAANKGGIFQRVSPDR